VYFTETIWALFIETISTTRFAMITKSFLAQIAGSIFATPDRSSETPLVNAGEIARFQLNFLARAAESLHVVSPRRAELITARCDHPVQGRAGSAVAPRAPLGRMVR